MPNIDIQSILSTADSVNNVDSQRKISNYLGTLMDSMPYIESVYIFDNYNNCYGVDKKYLKSLKINNLQQASWYDDVLKQDGYYILRLNSMQIFNLKKDEENTMSLIRVINSITNQQKLGILMVNISKDSFESCYKEMVSRYKTSIAILDGNDQFISNNDSVTKEEIQKITKSNGKSDTSLVLKHHDQSYIYSSMVLDRYGWKIILGIPMAELKKEASIYGVISLITLLFNGLLLLIGTIFISKLISNPIHKLLQSMKNIQNGKFTMMEMKTGNDEIGQLKDGYNIMVQEIENLIQKIVREQKTIRKAELNVLQEQIKPHFLYNTLNAMGYLALAGKNDELYDALEALGNYYKKCLSKGSEIITIEDEIEIVKDYLHLQQLRYGNILTVHFDVDPDTLKYTILKLIIQPLVENAIYHGIKPKEGHGHIYISSKANENDILLTVSDNGIGIDEDKLELLKAQVIDNNINSFGLRGTIERLKIYYDRSQVYNIESTKGIGTKITLMIPKK
jgi:two-component system sensor histidine kinase YesM